MHNVFTILYRPIVQVSVGKESIHNWWFGDLDCTRTTGQLIHFHRCIQVQRNRPPWWFQYNIGSVQRLWLSVFACREIARKLIMWHVTAGKFGAVNTASFFPSCFLWEWKICFEFGRLCSSECHSLNSIFFLHPCFTLHDEEYYLKNVTIPSVSLPTLVTSFIPTYINLYQQKLSLPRWLHESLLSLLFSHQRHQPLFLLPLLLVRSQIWAVSF